MNSPPTTPRSADIDPISLEHFPPQYGITLNTKVYNARQLAKMINHNRRHGRPVLIPHSRRQMAPIQIAAIMQLAGRVPPSAPRVTTQQRQLQTAERHLETALAHGHHLEDRDITVLIRHRMRDAYPSAVRTPYHHGQFHHGENPGYTQGEWNHMDLLWETDMVERLRDRFLLTRSIQL